MSNEPHIVIESVGAVYDAADGSLVALDDIDLSFERGEFVSIIGPSGCGKSTLLRIVGGLMSPTVDWNRPPFTAACPFVTGCGSMRKRSSRHVQSIAPHRQHLTSASE